MEGEPRGWVAPKSESCELDAQSLKSAKRPGTYNTSTGWPNGSGKGLGSLMTKRCGLEPRPVIWRFARIRRTSEADLRELASNSHEFPCPVPCPALPDLSELASNSQDSGLPIPSPCPCPCPRLCQGQRFKIHICLPLPLPPACPWPCPGPCPGPVFCDLSELASSSQDSHLPRLRPPAPCPGLCSAGLSVLASNSQDSALPGLI